jgi:hypothetical protein
MEPISLLDMIGAAGAGSMFSHSYAATMGSPPAPPGLRRLGLTEAYCGACDPKLPTPVESLRSLRSLRQQAACPECPTCKTGCHPIFYLGTATAAIMLVALILR